jgi:hypothetical protein
VSSRSPTISGRPAAPPPRRLLEQCRRGLAHDQVGLSAYRSGQRGDESTGSWQWTARRWQRLVGVRGHPQCAATDGDTALRKLPPAHIGPVPLDHRDRTLHRAGNRRQANGGHFGGERIRAHHEYRAARPQPFREQRRGRLGGGHDLIRRRRYAQGCYVGRHLIGAP